MRMADTLNETAVQEPEERIIKRALSLFHEDDRGCHLQSSFFDLEINLRLFAPKMHRGAQRGIRCIHHDLWQVAVIVSRLDWLRDMALGQTLHQNLWRLYSSVDIEAMMTQLRSIMDYSAEVIDSFAPKPNQLPMSFRKLRESLSEYTSRLPAGVEAIVREAAWFDTVRDVRDALVHRGAEQLVFCSASEGILFQVHIGVGDGLVKHPHLMYNDNVVDFSRFAAWTFSCLLYYLDELGRALQYKFEPPASTGLSSSYCPGFTVLRDWMRALFTHLHSRAKSMQVN